MSRTKAFDVDDALERAKNLFWARGYEATSMEDLLKAMGINRGSFYDTFQSKHALMLEALRRYDRDDRVKAFDAIANGLPPRDAILAVFYSRLDMFDDPRQRYGCFLINSAIEMAPRDAAIAQIVQEAFDDMARFFTRLVKLGQKAGQINTHRNSTQTGRLLLNHLLGILVLLRARTSPTMIKSMIKQVDDLLA
jgi:TetR/AcrR family transcriptional repressor of nem operon